MSGLQFSSRWGVRAACLTLFFGTLGVFSRALRGGFLDYDDPSYVTQNPHVQAGLTRDSIRWAFRSFDAANWHPFTWLSHELDWQLFGANPAGHHAVSVLWHAVAAVLAFLALRRLTRANWPSLVSAACFAWHPLRVESVAWIAERKDVLSACCALFALWAYAGYAERRRERQAGAGGWYGLALAGFAAGLLCKPMLVTLPFLFLLLDGWPLGRWAGGGPRGRLKLIAEKAPFFGLAAASSLVTYWAQKQSDAVVAALPLDARLANAAVSIARYLGKFFWPFGLATGYPSPARWAAAAVAGSALLIAALTALAWVQRRRRPWLLVGWLWFIGMLIPVLGIVQVGLQSMADRYTYLPTVGLQLAVFWTLREIKLTTAPRRRLAMAAAAVLLIGCAVRTWNQIGFWHDPVRLYRRALAVTPENYLAEGYLGTALLNAREWDEAEGHLRRSLELRPDYAVAALRLGMLLEGRQRPGKAMACYAALLRVKPNQAEVQTRMATLLLAAHRPSEAVDHFRIAAALRPPGADFYDRWGAALEAAGEPAEAENCYAREAQLRPDRARGNYNLGVMLLNRDQASAAVACFSAAVRSEPGFQPARAALALIQTGGQP